MIEEIGLKKVIKKKDPPKNQTDFLEKIEIQKSKREEKEKLKYLEKLESQVLKIKKKSGTNNTTITSEAGSSHKRLIDNLPKDNKQLAVINEKNLFDKKLLDDPEFRKTNIKKQKIEINCDLDNKENKNEIYATQIIKGNTNKNIEEEYDDDEEEILEYDFVKSLSKEKLKFFMFKASQIYNFLTSIKLVRYIEIFIEDGFEDLESILGKLILYFLFIINITNFL